MQAVTAQEKNSQPLADQLALVSENCRACGLCVKECGFLSEYGNPGEIAEACGRVQERSAFACSLCGLCTSICPFDVDPSRMFLEMRRNATTQAKTIDRSYKVIRNYEKRGASPRFSYYGLPEGCDTVFFPGCTLPGTRPEQTIKLFDHLRKKSPELGIVLDCCTKPSHDLGDEKFFGTFFDELRNYLLEHGVKKVIVACPNCYKIFQSYGDSLCVTSAYEVLDRDFKAARVNRAATVTVHDPCVVRFEGDIHEAVRSLIARTGLTIEEMSHTRENTICCGEGGAVTFREPGLSQTWSRMRCDEAAGRRVFTYCAGCANSLNPLTPTSHLLDLLFDPERTMAGKARVSRTPVTYFNRLRLKRYFQKNLNATTIRERPLPDRQHNNSGRKFRRLGLLVVLAVIVIAIRATGMDSYFDQGKLRELVLGYGALGPAVFVALYAIAPSLFLPGLPFAVLAGVLFGPFWGVVYAIIGSTAGATLAFLIGRYAGRQWLEGKLTDPKWQQMDKDVERLGWKMVAFTRLIPLFPFNLLNYAFGLTGIRLLDYVVASFIFMLPGCIAYILLSSSLLDVMRGSLSPVFFAGVLTVTALSSLPFLYRIYLKKARSRTRS